MVIALGIVGCQQTEKNRTPSTVDAVAGANFNVPSKLPRQPSGSVAVTSSPTDLRAPQLYFGTDGVPSPAATTSPIVISGQGAQINFENADIRDFLKAVLADTLGSSYSVDPKVQGTATVSSSSAITRQDLLATVETVLRMNGAAMISEGAGYRIVPANEAAGGRVMVQLGGDPTPLPAGYGVSIIPLRFVQAATIGPLISPIANSNMVRTDPTRNLVVVSGPSSDRAAVAEMIASFDVDAMRGVSAGLFPLHRSDPASIIVELRSVFKLGAEGTPMQGGIDFIPVRRLNAVMVVARQPARLRQAETWINRLDQGDKQGTQLYVYRVENGTAENLASIMSQFMGGGRGGTSSSGDSSTVAPGLQAQTASTGTALPSRNDGSAMDTGAIMSAGDKLGILSNDLTDMVGGGAGGGTGGGIGRGPDPFDGARIVANKERNSLMVMATPEAWRKIEAAIRLMDTPQYQVLIEATIAEVTLTDTLRYGVHYWLESGNFSSAFTQNSIFGVNPQVPGFNFIISSGNFRVILDALAAVTNVKVVSSPSLAVLDNQTAQLKVGDQVPVITRQQQSTDNPDAPIVNNVEYRDTGVILQVTPRINPDGQVNLDIRQEVSNVVEGTEDRGGNPTISQREVGTSVSVASGQTVILGGLISDRQSRGNSGIPVLRDIPLVGNLFSGVNNSDQRTELVILITPKVIRNAVDAKAVAEEFRSRMQLFGAPSPKK
ncbi:general secretion pathway protein D [Inquilinus ginsengisoli]|uniref:General secretion pathway protein D n=1 Tax=Inquilinus ginsengisoli TaxID=363840 RepID=A0ABU1JTG6_9PROT|nr:type II secretion system secretin GspD [Inquilinus ginsengisoli]MDR6290880.1 general secretion pathway protein D [Inquilinus ginsengisoli]